MSSEAEVEDALSTLSEAVKTLRMEVASLKSNIKSVMAGISTQRTLGPGPQVKGPAEAGTPVQSVKTYDETLVSILKGIGDKPIRIEVGNGDSMHLMTGPNRPSPIHFTTTGGMLYAMAACTGRAFTTLPEEEDLPRAVDILSELGVKIDRPVFIEIAYDRRKEQLRVNAKIDLPRGHRPIFAQLVRDIEGIQTLVQFTKLLGNLKGRCLLSYNEYKSQSIGQTMRDLVPKSGFLQVRNTTTEEIARFIFTRKKDGEDMYVVFPSEEIVPGSELRGRWAVYNG